MLPYKTIYKHGDSKNKRLIFLS